MLRLFQANEGYRYNSDTLFLYDFIARLKPKGRVLDVGCGCGILGLLLKRDFPALEVHLLDIQAKNCEIAHANALANHLEMEAFTCKDFLEERFEFKFDFIISNPPFYHQGVVKSENESLRLSRYSSALPFEAFVKKVSKNLSNRGYFCFCYDAKQLGNIMHALLENKLSVEALRFVHPKEDKEASLVLVSARKNSKSLCKIHAPLMMYQQNEMSEEAQAIFKHSQTKSLEWTN